MEESEELSISLATREAEPQKKVDRLLGKITDGEAEGPADNILMAELRRIATELEQVQPAFPR
jgi:hypothetical protein